MKVRLPGLEYRFCHLVTRDKCFHVLMAHFPSTKWEHGDCLLHRAFVRVEQDNPHTVFGPGTGT